MSQSGSVGSSSNKKKLFSRRPLSALTPVHGDPDALSIRNTLRKKKRTGSWVSNASEISDDGVASPCSPSPSASPASVRNSMRASSWLNPLNTSFSKSSRLLDETSEPQSSTSDVTQGTPDSAEPSGTHNAVLCYGEVQTTTSIFKKKKEYLVLTESSLYRFKSHFKAAELFPSIPSPSKRGAKHHSVPSAGSAHDLQSLRSDTSGDRSYRTPLRQIVAVYRLQDGGPYFAFDVICLDESNHAFAMTLYLHDPEEGTNWLKSIRNAADSACMRDENPISAHNASRAARAVEREHDYDPTNCNIYKVTTRSAKSGTSSTTDDLAKEAATVYLLAIGIHKVHLVPLIKPYRSSSPALASYHTQISFGILSLISVWLCEVDDTFNLTFRLPFREPKTLSLASLASQDIALRLRQTEWYLRPEWESPPSRYSVPDKLRLQFSSVSSNHSLNSDSFVRTLVAYCIAYNVNPACIRYAIRPKDQGLPAFELYPPVQPHPREYSAYELLAMMRALRYNESFGSISFRDVSLDALHGHYDMCGFEHICSRTRNGTPVALTKDAMERSTVLAQEVRALAITNKKLRTMDFTSSIRPKSLPVREISAANELGCDLLEALVPLCKFQTTNVDWIILNGIQLDETDLGYLIGAAVERTCHFRALEVADCGLDARSLSILLDAFRAQEETLELIDISRNDVRLSPAMFNPQISVFGFIRRLNLSKVTCTSGWLDKPLISYETLEKWRLEVLDLSGTTINGATARAIASYLRCPKSSVLHELKLDHTSLTGKDAANLLRSLSTDRFSVHPLHLDISENRIEQDLIGVVAAISEGFGPPHLTLRHLEFTDEAQFRSLVLALTANESICYLDISKASLPCAASDETSEALETLFAQSRTLEYLDISGEDSRLEVSRLGVGVNRALRGLTQNKTLRVLHIEHQRLGMQGATMLADILRSNTALEELHCDSNSIHISGFCDMVNALQHNSTLLHMSDMAQSREGALRMTEDEMKTVHQRETHPTPTRSVSASIIGKLSQSKAPAPGGPSTQDIKAAMTAVSDIWESQQQRLHEYLARNRALKEGVSGDAADAEQDATAGSPQSLGKLSVTKLLEQAKLDRTPTLERFVELGTHDEKDEDNIAQSPDRKGSRSSVSRAEPQRDGFALPRLHIPSSESRRIHQNADDESALFSASTAQSEDDFARGSFMGDEFKRGGVDDVTSYGDVKTATNSPEKTVGARGLRKDSAAERR